jgi:hypothetical protein
MPEFVELHVRPASLAGGGKAQYATVIINGHGGWHVTRPVTGTVQAEDSGDAFRQVFMLEYRSAPIAVFAMGNEEGLADFVQAAAGFVAFDEFGQGSCQHGRRRWFFHFANPF